MNTSLLKIAILIGLNLICDSSFAQKISKPLTFSETIENTESESISKIKYLYYNAEAAYQLEDFEVSKKGFLKIVDSFADNQNAQIYFGNCYYRLSCIASLNKNSGPNNNQLNNRTDLDLYYIKLAINQQPKNKDFLVKKAQIYERFSQNTVGEKPIIYPDSYAVDMRIAAAEIYTLLCTLDPHSWTFHEQAANNWTSASINFIDRADPKKFKSADAQKMAFFLVQQLGNFCDTWAIHLGNTPRLEEYKSAAVKLKSSLQGENKSHNAETKDTLDGGITEQKIASNNSRTTKTIFLSAINEQHFDSAHFAAEQLEMDLPIFSAHALVDAFQNLYQGKIIDPEFFDAILSTETDPFIRWQTRRLMALNFCKQGNWKSSYSIWFEIFNENGIQLHDFDCAIASAEKTQQTEMANNWKLLAQKLAAPR